MDRVPTSLLDAHKARATGDNPFQQRARLLQALWRERRGYEDGGGGQSWAGSRLDAKFARDTKANLMTQAARDAADAELAAKRGGSKQVIQEERLWTNLLSSQPLAFNLFAELQADLALATRVLTRLWPARVSEVTRIRFEYSPGHGDITYTHDHTAFDVFFEVVAPTGGRSFIGLEVKYHEALDDPPATHKPRYDEVTAAMRCFRPESLAALRVKPLEQIWRDHMLAGSMSLHAAGGWEPGLYVFLYPEGNEECRRAVHLYKDILSDTSTFAAVTLETMVAAIEAETDAAWIGEVRERYLGWQAIEQLIERVKTT